MPDVPQRRSTGTFRDLQAEVARSRILEAAMNHIKATTSEGDLASISWDMDFTLHIHADEEDEVVSRRG